MRWAICRLASTTLEEERPRQMRPPPLRRRRWAIHGLVAASRGGAPLQGRSPPSEEAGHCWSPLSFARTWAINRPSAAVAQEVGHRQAGRCHSTGGGPSPGRLLSSSRRRSLARPAASLEEAGHYQAGHLLRGGERSPGRPQPSSTRRWVINRPSATVTHEVGHLQTGLHHP